MFKGSMAALVAPMHKDGSLDYAALHNLVEWHIAAKTTAIIANGSTGECATLDADEQIDLLTRIIQQAAGRIPVIAGTGTNSTARTITLSEHAKRAGADACLIVTPYYNKPSQAGLVAHYKMVAEKIDLPIIMYNVPSRTGCDLLPDTVVRLSAIENIIGIKEATGKIERAQEILRHARAGFAVYSGDDATALALMAQGAAGVISITANVAPEKMHDACQAMLQGDLVLSEKIDATLSLLHQRLVIESNPVPVKWALHQMDKIQEGIRMPLLPLDKRYHDEVKGAMQIAGVLPS